MNKKKTILAMGILPLLGTLIACAIPTPAPSSSSSEGNVESSSNPSSSSAPIGDNGTVEISFWHTFGQQIVDNLELKVADFAKKVKEHEGVTVNITLKYIGGYPDILDNITKGLGAGTTPTIAVAYPDHVSDYLNEEGNNPGRFVVDMDQYINDPEIGFGCESWLGDAYDEEDFVKAFFEEGRSYAREGTYSLPFMKSSEALFYNKELLMDAMSIYKPELENSEDRVDAYMKTITWDDFMGLCKCIVDHKADISEDITAPLYYDSDANFMISKIMQNEIPFSSRGENGKGKIDFEEGTEAFDQAVDMINDLKARYNEGCFQTKAINNNKYSSSEFADEHCVFVVGSTGGTGNTIPKAGQFTLGVAPVPASNNNPLYVTQGPTLTLLKNAKYSDEENAKRTKYGWKFLKYLTNAQVNTEMCIRGSEGYIPVRESAYETRTFLEYMEEGQSYADTIKVLLDDVSGRYFNTAVFPGSATLRTQMGGIPVEVFKNNGDAAEVLRRVISETKLKM